MQSFDHFSPQSLDEALELLSRFNGRGQMIAGGTDLMLKMKAHMLSPEVVINIKSVPELQGISYQPEIGLRLGSLTTLRELTRSLLIREHYPSLAQASGLMASEQIRSFATIGGNICNASPSADLAPPLIALGATAVIVGPSGERHLPVENFFLGPSRSVLAAGELLKEFIIPPPQGTTIYLKHSPRAFMDIAIVGVAVRLHMKNGTCKLARIVLAAVAPVPLRVLEAEAQLEGQKVTSDNIARAAQIAAESCSPIDDVRGSVWYRRRMVEVLVKRGLTQLVGKDDSG